MGHHEVSRCPVNTQGPEDVGLSYSPCATTHPRLLLPFSTLASDAVTSTCHSSRWAFFFPLKIPTLFYYHLILLPNWPLFPVASRKGPREGYGSHAIIYPSIYLSISRAGPDFPFQSNLRPTTWVRLPRRTNDVLIFRWSKKSPRSEARRGAAGGESRRTCEVTAQL